MSTTYSKVVVYLLALALVEAAPFDDFFQDHDINHFQRQSSLKIDNDDPFESDFFKDFDRTFNSSSKFINNNFDDEFWSTSDLKYLDDNLLDHSQHNAEDRNSETQHEDLDYEKPHKKNKHHKKTHSESKKNKRKKHKQHKADHSHDEVDSVDTEIKEVAQAGFLSEDQDRIVKSFVRQQFGQPEEEEVEQPCTNRSTTLSQSIWLISELIMLSCVIRYIH